MDWVEINLPWRNNQIINYPKIDEEAVCKRYEFYEKFITLRTEIEKDTTCDNECDPVFLAEYREVKRKFENWFDAQPEVKEHCLKVEQVIEENKKKSFCGRELNKPGTIIQVDDGGEIKTLLIGNINTLGGVCDDCAEFTSDAPMVLRYKIVYSEQI